MKYNICCVLCVVIVFAIALVGCGESKSVSQEIPAGHDNAEIEAEETDVEEISEDSRYAENNIVNQFIKDFADTAGYEFTGIRQGNVKTKYYCQANNCYVELLDATKNAAGTFNISYSFSGLDGELTAEEIYEFFADCLKTLGGTDEEIANTIDALTVENEGNYMKEGYEVNDSITITYCPTKELSKGKTMGHIEIASSVYGK